MEKKYSITKDRSVELAWNYVLHRGKIRRFLSRNILVVSIAMAAIYALVSPPTGTVNGMPSPLLNISMMVLIQIPLVTLIIRFILTLFINQPKKIIQKQCDQLPSSHWGSRIFMVSDNSVKLVSPDSEITLGANLIDDIEETKEGIHLIQGKQSCIQLPKSDFSYKDVREAITNIKMTTIRPTEP